jgi:hypothetical protein
MFTSHIHKRKLTLLNSCSNHQTNKCQENVLVWPSLMYGSPRITRVGRMLNRRKKGYIWLLFFNL